MKFGLLDYNYGIRKYRIATNFGDEIQSIAASYFFPKIDYFIDREQISSNNFNKNEKIKVIMNGWWIHDANQWPPAQNIDPLLISMHFADKKEFLKNLFSKENIYYLSGGNSPVGARDLYTLELLQNHNIPSYFSGCLTLTLPKNESIKKQDYILCVDVNPTIVNYIKSKTSRPIYCISPQFQFNFFSAIDKFKIAFNLLAAYQGAHTVITTRLHAAMPSLALETPVLLIDKSKTSEIRFSGLSELVHSVKEVNYLNNLDYYDFDKPPQNSSKYLKYRKNLIEKCELFTGHKHNNITPLLQNNSPEELIVQNLNSMYNASKNLKIESYLTKRNIRRWFKEKLLKSFT